jgi:nitrate reductase alpha subunit
MANALALLDAHVRKVGPDQAVGSRGFDNYSWHTDLPPGHPMVTGQQTVEFDLSAVEHCRTAVVWGMNWIATKMPDAHWLTEARLKGTRVVVIACEYSATASKADDVLVVRPGTTPALALGFAHVIMRDRLYDADYVKRWTDLPILVRTDTLKYLRAEEVFRGGPAGLVSTQVLKAGEREPAPAAQRTQVVPEGIRREWGDYVWWDRTTNQPKPLTRDQVGAFSAIGDPLLEGAVQVTLADGTIVRCRPVFDLVKEYASHFDPKTVEELTWAPANAVESLARHFAKEPGTTLLRLAWGRTSSSTTTTRTARSSCSPRSRATSAGSAATSGPTRATTASRSSTARRSTSTRTRSTSSSTRPGRRGRASTGAPSLRTSTTTRTTRCASGTNC